MKCKKKITCQRICLPRLSIVFVSNIVLCERRKQEMVPRKRCKKVLQGTTILRVPKVPTTQEYFYKVENCLRAIYFTTRNLSLQFSTTGSPCSIYLNEGFIIVVRWKERGGNQYYFSRD